MTDPAVEAAKRAMRTTTTRDTPIRHAETGANEALKPIRALVEDARTWTPYNTRDIGSAYLAETVEDLLNELTKMVYPESELEWNDRGIYQPID